MRRSTKKLRDLVARAAQIIHSREAGHLWEALAMYDKTHRMPKSELAHAFIERELCHRQFSQADHRATRNDDPELKAAEEAYVQAFHAFEQLKVRVGLQSEPAGMLLAAIPCQTAAQWEEACRNMDERMEHDEEYQARKRWVQDVIGGVA